MFDVIVRPSVCRLSVVCNVRAPTQAIEIFGDISTPCGTLAIHDLRIKLLRRSSQTAESIVFLVRVQCRRKESSRSLSHLQMSSLFFLF